MDAKSREKFKMIKLERVEKELHTVIDKSLLPQHLGGENIVYQSDIKINFDPKNSKFPILTRKERKEIYNNDKKLHQQQNKENKKKDNKKQHYEKQHFIDEKEGEVSLTASHDVSVNFENSNDDSIDDNNNDNNIIVNAEKNENLNVDKKNRKKNQSSFLNDETSPSRYLGGA
jgi:hypothetical protein